MHRILHFLLASPTGFESTPVGKGVDMSISRRKSLDVLAAFSEEAARPSPSLFNLRDLALHGMQSANRQTVLATLRLMAVVLQRHHTFARSLIRTIPGQPAKQRTVGALNAELRQFLGMATSILDEPTLDDSFENYLKDASLIVESHLCLPPAEDDDPEEDIPFEIKQDDPIVEELLNCLSNFFTNSVIVNLALTEVLMSIASSHLLSLDRWLLVDPAKYRYGRPDTASEPTNVLDQIQQAYEEPAWSKSDTPTLTAVLKRLVKKLHQWRKDIPDFDILVAARRDLLHHGDKPATTPSGAPRHSMPPTDRAVRSQFEDLGSPRGRPHRPLAQHSIGTSPRRATLGAPLEAHADNPQPSRDSSVSRATAAEELRKRLAQPFHLDQPNKASSSESANGQQPETQADGEENEDSAIADEEPQVSTLGHVLTNVVILYEFLLEVSAMVQARGTLFDEAGFPDMEY